ncbi:MAG: hypothetical protein ACRCTJ_03795 [Brevinema sp.]
MKTFFIHLKIFLNSLPVKKFLQQFIVIFFFVFLFILGASWYYVHINSNDYEFKKGLQKLFAEPRNFNTEVNTYYDDLPLKENQKNMFYDKNFWIPIGTDVRYTIPKHGKPKTEQ